MQSILFVAGNSYPASLINLLMYLFFCLHCMNYNTLSHNSKKNVYKCIKFPSDPPAPMYIRRWIADSTKKGC